MDTRTLKLAKGVVVVFTIVIVVLLGILIFVNPAKGPTAPSMGSVAAQPAVSPDGHVTVTLPLSGALVSSPLAVSGTVTNGGWFFEAVFPIKVLDGDGTVIGQGQAQAQGDWMTTGTVPFAAHIIFTTSHYATGTVVFAKDNPSGLPQNAERFGVPVRFR